MSLWLFLRSHWPFVKFRASTLCSLQSPCQAAFCRASATFRSIQSSAIIKKLCLQIGGNFAFGPTTHKAQRGLCQQESVLSQSQQALWPGMLQIARCTHCAQSKKALMAGPQVPSTSAQRGPRGSPVAALLCDRKGSFRRSFCHAAECRQRCESVAVHPVSMAVCQIQSEHPLQPYAVLLLHFSPFKALPN